MRAAELNDSTDILALWAEAAENTGRPNDSQDAIESLIERDPGALIVAVLAGQIVGSAIAGWDGWRFHLYRLAVHPGHRRQGLGRALLGHAESRLVALGAKRIDAMVLDQNELGKSIWAATGYQRQQQWSRWVKSGEQPSP